MGLEGGGGHIQELALHAVGVRDDTAHEHVRGAGNRGDARGDETSGARLAYRQALPAQQIEHHGGEIGTVLAVAMLARSLAQRCEGRRKTPIRFALRHGPRRYTQVYAVGGW